MRRFFIESLDLVGNPIGAKMSAENRIFLTPEEALAAIRIDFNQYPPQNRLFLDLGPLILGPEHALIEDPHHDSVWITAPEKGRGRMRKCNFRELGDYLCHTLEKIRPDPKRLADLCARVFDANAYAAKNGSEGHEGIWLETGMDEFECRQCGRCCRNLDYRFELTETDYQLWQRLGRTDIMEWVAAFRRNGGTISYAIWITPGTRNYASDCPWLKKIPGTDRWECTIHDVKPEVCREYPASRKHAQMTGCEAFRK